MLQFDLVEEERAESHHTKPSLGGTLTMLMGQDRVNWYPMTLPVVNPHPNIARYFTGAPKFPSF